MGNLIGPEVDIERGNQLVAGLVDQDGILGRVAGHDQLRQQRDEISGIRHLNGTLRAVDRGEPFQLAVVDLDTDSPHLKAEVLERLDFIRLVLGEILTMNLRQSPRIIATTGARDRVIIIIVHICSGRRPRRRRPAGLSHRQRQMLPPN